MHGRTFFFDEIKKIKKSPYDKWISWKALIAV